MRASGGYCLLGRQRLKLILDILSRQVGSSARRLRWQPA
jgi:hypothetical protein